MSYSEKFLFYNVLNTRLNKKIILIVYCDSLNESESFYFSQTTPLKSTVTFLRQAFFVLIVQLGPSLGSKSKIWVKAEL